MRESLNEVDAKNPKNIGDADGTFDIGSAVEGVGHRHTVVLNRKFEQVGMLGRIVLRRDVAVKSLDGGNFAQFEPSQQWNLIEEESVGGIVNPERDVSVADKFEIVHQVVCINIEPGLVGRVCGESRETDAAEHISGLKLALRLAEYGEIDSFVDAGCELMVVVFIAPSFVAHVPVQVVNGVF